MAQGIGGSTIFRHKLGVKSAILYIGDDVIVWPKTNKNAFDEFKGILPDAIVLPPLF